VEIGCCRFAIAGFRLDLVALVVGLVARSLGDFMIVGTGIDIAEVPRIGRAIERFGERFLQRVFTAGEIRYCDSKANRVERYAARFAAKEAAMKALGTGWNHGVRWRDCEVVRLPGGRPTMSFHGKAGEFAAKLGTKNIALSLSHTAEQAIAQLILES
jgi:holo-[acyl-carrier protein] synthase